MRTPHKICPICSNNLQQDKFINALYPSLVDGKLSFIKYKCTTKNQVLGYVDVPFLHYFTQISSLYGELLLENIEFVENNNGININYIRSQTDINYKGISNIDYIKLNKIIQLDYPKLENVQQKINSLALFM